MIPSMLPGHREAKDHRSVVLFEYFLFGKENAGEKIL